LYTHGLPISVFVPITGYVFHFVLYRRHWSNRTRTRKESAFILLLTSGKKKKKKSIGLSQKRLIRLAKSNLTLVSSSVRVYNFSGWRETKRKSRDPVLSGAHTISLLLRLPPPIDVITHTHKNTSFPCFRRT